MRLRRPLGQAAWAVASALVLAPAAHASNDALATPSALTYGTAQQADTSNYGVEAGEQNTTTFPQQCDSDHPVGAGRTAWYTVTGTGGTVTVSTKGSNFDTSLFVYDGSPSGALVGCSDDAPGLDVQSLVSFDTVQGMTYAIQAGTACNANGPPPCSRPPDGGTLNILASGTPPSGSSPPPSGGSPTPPSGSPSPGGGAPATLPPLTASASLKTVFAKSRTLIRSLSVAGAPVGSSIVVSCSKRRSGCPFTSKDLAVKSAARAHRSPSRTVATS